MTDSSTKDEAEDQSVEERDDAQDDAPTSATADRIPEPGADIEEGEVHGDASRLDTDVEGRIDAADHVSRSDDSEDVSEDDSGSGTGDEASDDEIEKERQERLDPDNRPSNAEVDNSARDFDIKHGQFTDHEVDEGIGPFNDPTAPDGEIEA